jgi:ActR/RegA family two-component response regulator
MKLNVLHVGDDGCVLEKFAGFAGTLPIRVTSACSATEAVGAMRRIAFDLLVIDLRSPNAAGLEVIRVLRRERFDVPLIILGAGTTLEVVVDAMRLGTMDAIEKLAANQSAQGISRSTPLNALQHSSETSRIKDQAIRFVGANGSCSAADRLAIDIVSMIDCEEDPRTIADWAKHARSSYSTIREHCKLACVRPYRARDFGRVLRAICWSGRIWLPETVLACADIRTLNKMMELSGFEGRRGGPTPSVPELLVRQQWIPQDHPEVLTLSTLVRRLSLPNSPGFVAPS